MLFIHGNIYSSRILYGRRMELPLSGGRMGGTGVLPGPPLLPSSQPPLADSPWSLLNSPPSFRQSQLPLQMLKMPNTCFPILCIMGMGLWQILGQKGVKKQSFGGQGRLQRTDFLPIKTREWHAWGNSLHIHSIFAYGCVRKHYLKGQLCDLEGRCYSGWGGQMGKNQPPGGL